MKPPGAPPGGAVSEPIAAPTMKEARPPERTLSPTADASPAHGEPLMNADREPLDELLRAVLAHGRAQGMTPLDDAQRVAFLIMELDAYAREQELLGFYAGPHGGRAVELVESLEAVGALQSGALIRRANSLFPNGRPPLDHEERLRVIHSLDDETKEALRDIGREFLTYYDSLSRRLHAFAREEREALAAGL